MTRREFGKSALTLSLAAGLGAAPFACARRERTQKNKVVLLGFDGMDPDLLGKLVHRGQAPNLEKLMRNNTVLKLATSTPPQSPVAWADAIAGADPGVHGIFDFIHRNPETYSPYLSTSEAYPATKKISAGKYRIPLKPGGVRLLRRGAAFWDALEDAGVPCTVFRIPSNFPPSKGRARTVSGMGTPDLLGGYGSFTCFTTDYAVNAADMTGGQVRFVNPAAGRVDSSIPGPPNEFHFEEPPGEVPFTVFFDRSNPVARLDLQGQSVILKTGEWSRWLSITFENVPHLVSASGMVRVLLQELRPYFRMYVSPVNIDPRDPAMPISTPPDYAAQLARALGGPFSTLGMPEDTKALDHGILSDDEYRHIADQYHQELTAVLFHNLDHFDGGFLFHYFGDTDLGSHMFWSAFDPEHPMHERRDKKSRDAIYDYYRNLDRIAGRVMKYLGPDDTLMIMSDHGFAPFYRAVNLNTWLKDNEFLGLTHDDPEAEFFSNADWSVSRAYAMGFNGLYVNEQGREGGGIVPPGPEKEKLLRQLQGMLLEFKDPETGIKPISSVYRATEVYSPRNRDLAPDLVIGYRAGYRASDETALGAAPLTVTAVNERKWSGDHCVDPAHVPGVVLCNKKIKARAPGLRDIAATMCARFNAPPPGTSRGKNIL